MQLGKCHECVHFVDFMVLYHCARLHLEIKDKNMTCNYFIKNATMGSDKTKENGLDVTK